MKYRIHEKIRRVLESNPALTQKGLAAYMGLNPAAVNRMLYGKRNILAEEIPLIEKYLGVVLARAAAGAETGAETGNVQYLHSPQPPAPNRPTAHNMETVPVYRHTHGDIADWTARHPAQAGNAQAFAVYVADDSMAPRYFPGELVYIHPGRPPQAGQDCLILHHDSTMQLARFAGQSGETLTIGLLRPEKTEELQYKAIKDLYAVVGRG